MICPLGQKNSAASGTAVDIDAIDVKTNPYYNYTTKRVEEKDADLIYSGNWSDLSHYRLSGGTARNSSDLSSKVEYSFTGRSVDVITYKSKTRGMMEVTVDDRVPQIIDCYDDSYDTLFQHRVTVAKNLDPDVVHTITIRPLGQKNAAAVGYLIDVDAIDVRKEPRTTYSYNDPEWKDLLTAYDGKPITYDEIGNPLSYDG